VQWVIRHDPEGRIQFASLQSPLARKQLGDVFTKPGSDPETVVFQRNGQIFTHSSAALQVLAELGRPWSFFLIFLWVPAFLRDAVYGLVARNRYRWFGKAASCMIPDPAWKSRFPEDGIHPENV
jgi:predicted DCC family thiol-disulfide oxidoreductase YuxK